MTYKKIMVLAPHTDDGELGCGATIHKFLGLGAQVYYVAYSTCRRSLPAHLPPDTLEKEVKQAVEILGIPAQNLLLRDFDVRHFSNHRQQILEDMVFLKNQIKPDLVLVPSSADMHQDHQVIRNEAERAFKHCSIWGYEMPWNNTIFRSNTFVKIEKTNLDAKIQALTCYKSQQHREYLTPQFISGLATVRGVQAGCEYAEAYEAIKIVHE